MGNVLFRDKRIPLDVDRESVLEGQRRIHAQKRSENRKACRAFVPCVLARAALDISMCWVCVWQAVCIYNARGGYVLDMCFMMLSWLVGWLTGWLVGWVDSPSDLPLPSTWYSP